jgi:hypothetical protein
MTSPHWPLTGLVLRTPRIDLRWPALADLDALATLAEEGIHDPGVQPFKVPWTDAPPADRARSTLHGTNRLLVRDQPVQAIRFRLDRAAWQAHRTVPVEILGLAECLPCFGLAS